MKMIQSPIIKLPALAIILMMTFSIAKGQNLQISLSADPVISWFSSDTRDVVNKGARPGFSLALQVDNYFTENYAFSTGITVLWMSGRLNYSDTLHLRFKNSEISVPGNEDIIYKIQYLSVPVGLKLKTNQIGYITFFTNIGFDPKVMIGGKADIPFSDITDENITEELKLFNLGYHFTAGIEYSLGGNTALLIGLGYENAFLDTTKDYDDQPVDKIGQHIIRFKLGLNF